MIFFFFGRELWFALRGVLALKEELRWGTVLCDEVEGRVELEHYLFIFFWFLIVKINWLLINCNYKWKLSA
jgi:hypothetical protein